MNVIYELPLGEIVFDFFDKLKSCTKGYASLDYELIGYQTNKLAKMDILFKRGNRRCLKQYCTSGVCLSKRTCYL